MPTTQHYYIMFTSLEKPHKKLGVKARLLHIAKKLLCIYGTVQDFKGMIIEKANIDENDIQILN